MAWIGAVDESEATGELKDQYDNIMKPKGMVDNILKIHSLNPPSLHGHYRFYRSLMYGKSPLSRIQREMIAVTVSAVNQCFY